MILPPLDEYEDMDKLPYRGEHQCYMHNGDACFHGTEYWCRRSRRSRLPVALVAPVTGNWWFGWQENAWPSGGFRIGVDKSIGASTLDELYRCYDYV